MIGSRPLNNQEVDSAFNSFDGTFSIRNQTLFSLGCKSGFRVSELLSLKVRDVWQHGRIVDHVTVKRADMKKQMASRTVILGKATKAQLASYIETYKLTVDQPLFPSRKGDDAISRVQAWRILNNIFTKLSFTGKLGTHCMRKTFADRVYILLNKDLVATQKALGHSNINSTVSYLSFKQDDINEAILSL